MIKKGDFEKICNISARTLRYYDQEGVLKADLIDEATGYRFYSPEAVEKYKKIVFYKELGFSLQEIKELQVATEEQIKEMLKKKKGTLLSSVEQIQDQVQTINGMFHTDGEGKSLSNILHLPFVDDPEVVGKWTLCGMIPDETDLNSVVEIQSRYIFKELIFLPGGAPVWSYFWTKGILYTLLGGNQYAVPNAYNTFRKNGDHYMVIHFVWGDGTDNEANTVPILYRQLDNVAYSEDQTRPHIDKVDYPFVGDAAVSGVWSVVDFVPCVEAFAPTHQFTPPHYLHTIEMTFLPRGMCVKTFRSDERGKKSSQILHYTKGLVLNRTAKTAEEYIIKTFGGKDYLLVQHKSGDYFYGGYEPKWYVFQRKENAI